MLELLITPNARGETVWGRFNLIDSAGFDGGRLVLQVFSALRWKKVVVVDYPECSG
jgi:hypothetical protein